MSTDLMNPVNKFYQVYNENALDMWEEAMSPSYVGHVNGQDVPNRETGKGFIQALLVAFPNINYTVNDTVIQGNKVVSRWSATGTHTGDLFGMPPTNKDVNMIGITIFRIENGQIAELWDVWDQAGLMEQLNAE
jgi:steroid delta-isomerase-like uncharacterized protein